MNNSSFTPTVDTFHFLVDRLQITPESRAMQKAFERYDKEHPDDYHLQEMEDFAEQWKDPGSESYTNNTYNGESTLSQVIQFTVFTKDEHCYVLLQVHGGADVRGGYTRPHVFEVGDLWDLANDNDITASVGEGENHKYWTTDDGGNHWYFDGTYSSSPEWLANPDVPGEKETYPRTWEIREDGVFYKPTGQPISFGYSENQWWMQDPNLVAKYAPTPDEKQKTLTRKRLKA